MWAFVLCSVHSGDRCQRKRRWFTSRTPSNRLFHKMKHPEWSCRENYVSRLLGCRVVSGFSCRGRKFNWWQLVQQAVRPVGN